MQWNPLEQSSFESWTHYNVGVLRLPRFWRGLTISRPIRIYWYTDLHAQGKKKKLLKIDRLNRSLNRQSFLVDYMYDR